MQSPFNSTVDPKTGGAPAMLGETISVPETKDISAVPINPMGNEEDYANKIVIDIDGKRRFVDVQEALAIAASVITQIAVKKL